jgi:ribosomal protein S18 acetylase RimI-like enzyme
MDAIVFQRATTDEVDDIAAIIERATAFLREQGSPQWQGGYGPDRAAVERDVARGEGFVLLCEGKVCAYAALARGVEPCYATLMGGAWDARHDRYATIHRVAVDTALGGQGLGRRLMDELVAQARAWGFRDLRIDTHPMNAIMQKLIARAGFSYVGMIEMPIPHGERRAYQLLLD